MALSLMSLLLADGGLAVQLTITCFWAVAWFLAIRWAAKNVFEPWIASKPWADQWTDMHAKTYEASIGLKFKSRDEVFEFACLFLAIICQHAVGGVLCLPSLLGGSTGIVAAACARHGGLCEAGWELQDAFERAYQILFGTEQEKAKNPLPLVLFMAFHHAMGLSMVIPMNLYYPDNAYYHEFIFLLQGAAFAACVAQNYGYSLDVKTASGLFRMKASVAFSTAVIAWSRVLRYGFVGYKLIGTMYADGNIRMLCVGCLVLMSMGVVNLVFITDALKKLVKFMSMKHSDDKEELHDEITRLHSTLHKHCSQHSDVRMTSRRRSESDADTFKKLRTQTQTFSRRRSMYETGSFKKEN